MAIARRLQWYLDQLALSYELVRHAHTETALDSARAAHIPSGKLAKCVLLEDERGYLLAILPASCRLDLDEIEGQVHRKLELASESEVGELFGDCEVGALPATGGVYNVPTLVDDSLLRLPDVYFEGGDHEELVHLSGTAFRALLAQSRHGRICRPS
jgi:Ala-tRNA(Pro) deacylase